MGLFGLFITIRWSPVFSDKGGLSSGSGQGRGKEQNAYIIGLRVTTQPTPQWLEGVFCEICI